MKNSEAITGIVTSLLTISILVAVYVHVFHWNLIRSIVGVTLYVAFYMLVVRPRLERRS